MVSCCQVLPALVDCQRPRVDRLSCVQASVDEPVTASHVLPLVARSVMAAVPLVVAKALTVRRVQTLPFGELHKAALGIPLVEAEAPQATRDPLEVSLQPRSSSAPSAGRAGVMVAGTAASVTLQAFPTEPP